MLSFRVTQKQLFALIKGDLLFRRSERIQNNISIGKPYGSNDFLSVLVKIDFCLQRHPDQPFSEFITDFNGTPYFQIRQYLADDPFRVVQRIFHQASAFILVIVYKPDQLCLFLFGPDQITVAHHPGTP